MDASNTARELYEEHGYDPEDLIHPRDATPETFEGGATIVAYTCVRNPDIDGPATTWDLVEWELDEDDVRPVDAEFWEENSISWTDSSPVTHGVHWGWQGSRPLVVSIGYGKEMYDGSDFDDPNRWDRTVGHIRGVSDSFVRFSK